MCSIKKLFLHRINNTYDDRQTDRGLIRPESVGCTDDGSLNRTYVPVPLLVDLAKVDAVADDAAAAGGEEHVAEGAPELVGERPGAEEQQEEDDPPVGVRRLPHARARRHRLADQRPVKDVLHHGRHGPCMV
jgi:hypothetical protein